MSAAPRAPSTWTRTPAGVRARYSCGPSGPRDRKTWPARSALSTASGVRTPSVIAHVVGLPRLRPCRPSGSTALSTCVSLPPSATSRRPARSCCSHQASDTWFRRSQLPFHTSTAWYPTADGYSHGGPNGLGWLTDTSAPLAAAACMVRLTAELFRLAEFPAAVRPPGVPVSTVRGDPRHPAARWVSTGPVRERSRVGGQPGCGPSRPGSRVRDGLPRPACRPARSRRPSAACDSAGHRAASRARLPARGSALRRPKLPPG